MSKLTLNILSSLNNTNGSWLTLRLTQQLTKDEAATKEVF
jgi:hypothetical protein